MTLTIYESLEQGTPEHLARPTVRNFKEPYVERARRRFRKFIPDAHSDGCWEWQSVRNRRGYGKFWFYGRTDLAHRVSYELHNGPIPDGAVVRHKCDNPPCVNPAHLLTGTPKDNSRDAMERGQVRRGASNGRSKLTPEQVRQIKSRRAGGETQKSLALSFGVSIAAVQWILNGTNWSTLEDSP